MNTTQTTTTIERTMTSRGLGRRAFRKLAATNPGHVITMAQLMAAYRADERAYAAHFADWLAGARWEAAELAKG